jgi:angiomotin like
MSSNPQGIRFPQLVSTSSIKTGQQAQQQTPTKHQTIQSSFRGSSLSGSDTESISNENLSNEERFVLYNTSRVEPLGQENQVTCDVTPVNENQQIILLQSLQPRSSSRVSSNTSIDLGRYATGNRNISESRVPVFNQQQPGIPSIYVNQNTTDSNRSSIIHTANNSNQASVKDTNSNRSSIDVSQSSYNSYNTLIIHKDESIDAITREHSSPPPYLKKDRPRSYGEQQVQICGMKEITEIPEEYFNQSHVLKHLAKEVQIPNRRLSEKCNWTTIDDLKQGSKVKSKSQPDLTRLLVGHIDIDIKALIKENTVFRQQLQNCYTRLAKSQKVSVLVQKIINCIFLMNIFN